MAADRSRILLVRHGKGRGRDYKYNQEFVRWAEAARPELWDRLRLHFTGEPPPCLDGVGAVVFWVGDPLRERYPEEYAECSAIARRARQEGIRIANPPDALSNARKGLMSELWRAAGIPTPPCHPFQDLPTFESAVRRTAFPSIARGTCLHAQEHIRVFAEPEEALDASVETLPLPGVLSPLVDTRSGHREEDPSALAARFYHKKRVMVWGDVVVPWHLYFSEDPVIGDSASTLLGPSRIRTGWRSWMRGQPEPARSALEAERAFIRAAPESPELFRRAVRVLGLDFAAVDYATPARDELVLWEANPYPYLAPAAGHALIRERGLEDRERRCHDATAAWMVELADAPGDRPDAPNGPETIASRSTTSLALRERISLVAERE
jgi:hypothetical protein